MTDRVALDRLGDVRPGRLGLRPAQIRAWWADALSLRRTVGVVEAVVGVVLFGGFVRGNWRADGLGIVPVGLRRVGRRVLPN